jgi:Domain of unknown function (DUF4340)
MFKNISSKNLLIIFAVLLAIAAFFIYYDSSHEIRTFKKDIVNIDTSAVTSISIYPKVTDHKEVRLYKQGNSWQIQIDNNKSVPAEASKVKNLLNTLVGIKANSLAAQDESKWAEFKVDSSGTRVKVFEGNDNTLDIIIGKFSYQQPRSMSTYVRIKGDKNVYQVDGFLEYSFNQKPNYFRNNTIVNDDFSNWQELTYTYPDSSFQMVKDTSGFWTINNIRTDSAKTVNFIRTLSRVNGTEFIDNPDPSLLGKAKYTLTIESIISGHPAAITVSAYSDQLIIHSSQNPDSYFDGNPNSLWQKIFAGKSRFLKNK